jgi:hypothetical protein
VAGRPKGSQNKISLRIKEAIIETFAALGGVSHMTQWARENPSEFYRLAARLVPTEMALSGETTVKHELKLAPEMTREEWELAVAERTAKLAAERAASQPVAH